MFKLFKKKPTTLSFDFKKLTPAKQAEVREAIDSGNMVFIPNLEMGDGKAEFLDEGSHEEYEELLKKESGLQPWYKRIGL